MDKDLINKQLTERYKRLNKLTESIEKKLLILPEGKIRILRKHNSDYYYYVDKDSNDNGTIINSLNLPFAQGLAQRSYLQKVLRAANSEQKLIEQFIKRFPSPSVEQVYQTLPEPRQKLITPIILPDDQYIKQWLDTPYIHKGFSEGDPYYEHLGKMGDRDYAAKNISKLNLYALNGFIQGDRLFTTMESADCPFDVRVLDRMIEKNFR